MVKRRIRRRVFFGYGVGLVVGFFVVGFVIGYGFGFVFDAVDPVADLNGEFRVHEFRRIVGPTVVRQRPKNARAQATVLGNVFCSPASRRRNHGGCAETERRKLAHEIHQALLRHAVPGEVGQTRLERLAPIVSQPARQ